MMLSKHHPLSVCLLLTCFVSAAYAQPPLVRIVHDSPVTSIAWFADGLSIATGTKDSTVYVFEAQSGLQRRSFPVTDRTRNGVLALAISPDGNWVATHDGQAAVVTWDVATGNAGETYYGLISAFPGRAPMLAFLPDYSGLVCAGAGGCFEAVFGELPGRTLILRRADPRESDLLSLSPDGRVFGWFNGNDKLTMAIRRPAGFRECSIQVGSVRQFALSTDGKLLAVATAASPGVDLWDLDVEKKTATLAGLQKPATQLAFSADGTTVAALQGDGKCIQVWGTTNAKQRAHINCYERSFSQFALSHDGQRLATIDNNGMTLGIWNIAGQNNTKPPAQIALTPNEFAAVWTDLGDAELAKAHSAWTKLVTANDDVIPLVRERIRPIVAPPANMENIVQLVRDLGSDKYATREAAGKALLGLGEIALLPLERMLENPPSLEAATRAKAMLKKIGEPEMTPDRIRVFEAIDLLEQMGTEKAVELLREIERDALIAQIHHEAVQALKRVSAAKESK